ncbi:MAG TPA: hypothetical protein VIT41_04280, partial [Microlunatus sp.]
IGPNTASEDQTAKEGDPYVIVTLVWANTSTSEVELTPLITVRSSPDGTEAPRVYVDEARDSLILEPGEATEYDVGVIMPAERRKAATLEIADPVDPSRAVTFTGAIG